MQEEAYGIVQLQASLYKFLDFQCNHKLAIVFEKKNESLCFSEDMHVFTTF